MKEHLRNWNFLIFFQRRDIQRRRVHVKYRGFVTDRETHSHRSGNINLLYSRESIIIPIILEDTTT